MLIPFRKKAVEEGSAYFGVDPIPAEEVDRWLGHARPCAVLRQGGDGPVAGRFGGPLMLPDAVPDPEHPYVGSVDLAALPKDSTDLPLPPDGRLLLFVSLWDLYECESLGQAVYVPAGTPVAERDRNTWKYSDDEEYRGYVDSFPPGELRVRTEPDLPYHPLPGFPHGGDLSGLWSDVAGRSEHLQIGGYADQEDSDPDPLETGSSYFRWGLVSPPPMSSMRSR
jgi:hypothetical protein